MLQNDAIKFVAKVNTHTDIVVVKSIYFFFNFYNKRRKTNKLSDSEVVKAYKSEARTFAGNV